MKKTCFAVVLAWACLAACASPAPPTATLIPTEARPTTTPPPTATPFVTATSENAEEGRRGLSLSTSQNELFSASGACAPCHTDMQDESGADVSIDSTWRSTMMGNAARDPYFIASVAAEVARNPGSRATIEDACATCHMPMARFTDGTQGVQGAILGEGYLAADHPLHELAMDGVSCTLCHQIRETNLGPPSYSGNFTIDTALPRGERLIFGPYTVEEDQAVIMQSVSGFRPIQAIPWGQGLHLTQPELCATCHTLYTPILDASGQVAGEFPEQVPYLEWFYSDYRRAQTCQQCHMPSAVGGVRIALTSITPRSPFAQHIFVGGNVYMLQMLDAFGEELGVTASSEHFGATMAHTLDQLQNQTASLSLEEVELTASRMTAEVVIGNLTGHKFPTAFPSRRAWIHFSVRDASGQVIFDSGGYNPDGSIIGNDADDDASRFEPHYETIGNPAQVQIYEAVLRDTAGTVTTDLLRAAGFAKDNRLLPSGFEKGAPYPDIAVRGSAMEDEDFLGGGDRVQYIVNVANAQAPFTVTVELLYQSVGFRWAHNLGDVQAEEVSRFLGYYGNVPNVPVVISAQTLVLGD